MRLCVFADIHGNRAALDAALGSMRGEGASLFLFLGDLCGYYPEAYPSYLALRGLDNLAAVLGNHDRMFLDILDGDQALRASYRERYGLAMERLLEQGGPEVGQWLRTLPCTATLAGGAVLAVHGSPSRPLEEYVYPDSELPAASGPGLRWVLMGHTHHKMRRERGGVAFLNPGSVGQPRDGGWPSYAVLDTETGEWVWRAVRYDRELTRRAVRQAGDATPYLARVLDRMGEQ